MRGRGGDGSRRASNTLAVSAAGSGKPAFMTGIHCSSPSALTCCQRLDIHQCSADLHVGAGGGQQIQLVALLHPLRRQRCQPALGLAETLTERTKFPTRCDQSQRGNRTPGAALAGNTDCGHGPSRWRSAILEFTADRWSKYRLPGPPAPARERDAGVRGPASAARTRHPVARHGTTVKAAWLTGVAGVG